MHAVSEVKQGHRFHFRWLVECFFHTAILQATDCLPGKRQILCMQNDKHILELSEMYSESCIAEDMIIIIIEDAVAMLCRLRCRITSFITRILTLVVPTLHGRLPAC